MKQDKIILGDVDAPLHTFAASLREIRGITYTKSVDVIGAELSVDIMTPIVEYPYNADSAQVIGGVDFAYIRSADGYIMSTNKRYYDLRTVPYGTLIRYLRDDALIFKGYVKSVDRVGRATFRLNVMSAIGLLDTQYHYGNIYTGQTFETVLAEIIDGAVDYTVADNVKNIAVYGWLPYATKRANLHKLLFASGVMVGRNEAGDMDFRFISNAEATPIPDGRIYNSGSIDYSSPASQVDITEHSYMALASDETVVVYDNTDGSETANHTLIQFRDAPLHDLTVTDTLTIEDSGVNYAIVTGTGVLSGQKYTHSTRILTKYAENAGAQRENIVSVAECTLINVANSENVAKRVLSYYSSKKTVRSDIVLENEAVGTLIAATDPFYDSFTGFLATIDANVSSIIKGNCTVITDYVPTQGGNNFTRAILYTGEGEIDFAELAADKDNDLVQAVLIGGGHGGYSGENGTSGTNGSGHGSSGYDLGTPGVGGASGKKGEGAKVYTITFRVSDLAQAILSYQCGKGGESDKAGTATVLGDWTSENGATTPYGVANIFTGEIYASAGIDGQAGGDGVGQNGNRPTVSYQEETWTAGEKGADRTFENANNYQVGRGGYGGGAAVGSNGNNGQDAGEYGTAGGGGSGANGRDGADSTVYGGGGNGGFGGGGGGIGGWDLWVGRGNNSGSWYTVAGNGAGGKGGLGGKGGNGLLMILI